MILLLVIHIIAVLFWCAALLYIPAVIAAKHGKAQTLNEPKKSNSMARFIFTNISGPFALIAIIAGTLIFTLEYKTEFWLVIKLTLVACLAILHALTGALVLAVENDPRRPVFFKSFLLGGTALALMVMIIYVVLLKPASLFGLVAFP